MNDSDDEDPNNPDVDDDGVLDGIDPDNTTDDADGDGVTDADELKNGTDPTNSDSDEDGLSDAEERDLGTDPNRQIQMMTVCLIPMKWMVVQNPMTQIQMTIV